MGVLGGEFRFRIKSSPRLSVAVDAKDAACPICQQTVGSKTPDGIVETWSTLPCGHSFGAHCLKSWLGLAEQPSCPVCRRDMVHTCGHPVLPTPAGKGRLQKKRKTNKQEPSLSQTCQYCVAAQRRNPRRGLFSRVALGSASKLLCTRKMHERLDQMYWERWRSLQSNEFGKWWADQEPRTAPARPAPVQNWVF